MIDLGYNDRNAFSGLKTVTFVLLLYFARVLLALIAKILVSCISCKNKNL